MPSRLRWLLEWEIWALLAVAGAIYLTRLNDTLPTDEEPRRGQVAREMIATGDWIVPRQQGFPFLSRPPVQNWLIALLALMRGGVDTLAIRLPSALSLLATAAMIYGYSRTFLTRLGALIAGLAYSTMFLTLQFGWLGETESLYTLVVAGSLIFWRWADAAKRPLIAWTVGYGLAGIGMLTKGPQAPVYFAGGVVLYLLIQWRVRDIFRWQHLVGIVLFFAIWLAWEIPFIDRVGNDAAWVMLVGDIAMRFQGSESQRWAKHLVECPAGLVACTMPWSALLLAFVRRDFRQSIADKGPDTSFIAATVGFIFLTCLLAPGARNRYFAPALPLVACLIGLVAQQCALAVSIAHLQALARRFFLCHAGVLLISAAWVMAVTCLGLGALWGQQPLAFAIVFFATAVLLAMTLVWASRKIVPLRVAAGGLALAAFLGLSETGVMMNIFRAVRQPIGVNVAKVKAQLPADVHLVSIGAVDDVFMYYYANPIERLPMDKIPSREVSSAPEPPWEYFCMGCGPNMPEVKFDYEKLAEVSVDAGYVDHPHDKVIVGRRRPTNVARRNTDTTRVY